MLKKVLNEHGQKAYQRQDTEDRSLIYRNWLRTVETGGFFLDIDFIKWKTIKGELIPIAITDLTRCDKDDAGFGYLQAITHRLFVRDRQGHVLRQLGKLLRIPVYLVLFQKDMKWLKVFSFQTNEWRNFTPEEWANYLKNL